MPSLLSIRLVGACAVLGLLAAATSPRAAKATESAAQEPAAAATPRGHIETLGEEAIEVLLRPNSSDAARETRLRELLKEGLGIRIMGRTVAGEAWSEAGEEARQAFRRAFGRYFINHLIGVMAENEPDDFEVTSVRDLDERDTLVTTAVERFNLTWAEVKWRVRDTPRGFEIVDVIRDGISLIGVYSDEFGGFAERRGLAALTEALERKARQN